MFDPWSREFSQAKRLKRRGRPPRSPFRELAEWISSHYDVYVIDIQYDTVTPDDRPRLDVIVERDCEKQKFLVELGNFDKTKANCVKREFMSLIAEQGITGFKTNGLFAIFSSFERAARVEANQRVSERKLKRLQQQLGNPDLWKISIFSDEITFFFYTESQAKEYEADGLKEKYIKKYTHFIRKYDEFGYLADYVGRVFFDSKERFHRVFNDNWWAYYK